MSSVVKVGVYLDRHGHTAVVLRAKEGRVTFLSMNQTKPERFNGSTAYMPVTQNVDVETMAEHRFVEQYVTHLPQYPVRRALEKYWRSGLTVTPAAEHVIAVALKNLQARA